MSPSPRLSEGVPLMSKDTLVCNDLTLFQKSCKAFLPEGFNSSRISLLSANTKSRSDLVAYISIKKVYYSFRIFLSRKQC